MSERMVLVRWVDSTSLHGWQQMPDVYDFMADGLPEYDSIGFVVGDDENALTIVQSLGEGNCGHVMKIPKASVLTITELKTVRKR